MGSGKIVTVFGSSRAGKNSRIYKEAYQLGKLLAEAGIILCNGGYGGTMDAASRGAKEAGGRTVGITMEAFRRSPNPWIDVESRATSSMERLMVMTSIADAFIVLQGGVGTLAEMAFVWSSTAIGELRKPVLLMGDAWRETIDNLSKHMLIGEDDRGLLKLVGTPEEAVAFLNELWLKGE
jgi:uncharacterized protein (TIGR00730 family)